MSNKLTWWASYYAVEDKDGGISYKGVAYLAETALAEHVKRIESDETFYSRGHARAWAFERGRIETKGEIEGGKQNDKHLQTL